MNTLLKRLKTPCGRTTGHGESCVRGYECGVCAEKAEAAACIELLESALRDIAEWNLPATGEFWPSGNPVSYEAKEGSLGVSWYIRQVASDALQGKIHNKPLAISKKL